MIRCIKRGDDINISIRLTKEESELIRKYAELNKTTVSDVMLQAILSKIEDEFNIFLYEEAYKEFKKAKNLYVKRSQENLRLSDH